MIALQILVLSAELRILLPLQKDVRATPVRSASEADWLDSWNSPFELTPVRRASGAHWFLRWISQVAATPARSASEAGCLPRWISRAGGFAGVFDRQSAKPWIKNANLLLFNKLTFVFGAVGETRTHTGQRPLPPQSSVSTISPLPHFNSLSEIPALECLSKNSVLGMQK